MILRPSRGPTSEKIKIVILSVVPGPSRDRVETYTTSTSSVDGGNGLTSSCLTQHGHETGSAARVVSFHGAGFS